MERLEEIIARGEDIVREHDISVILLAYNEESRIEYTLKSLKKFPEIILIDKCSTDRTVEIAKKYGAKIISVPNYDDIFPKPDGYQVIGYSEAEKMAKFEWIFPMMSSEVVHRNLHDELIKLINSDFINDYNIVNIPNKEFILGYTGKYIPTANKPDRGMFRKGICKYQDKVHQEMCVTGRIYNMSLDTDVAVYHMSYIGLAHSYRNQICRYASSEIKKIKNLNMQSINQILNIVEDTKKQHLKAIIVGYVRTFKEMGKHAFVISLWRNVVYNYTIILYIINVTYNVNTDEFLNAIQGYLDNTTSLGEILAERKKYLKLCKKVIPKKDYKLICKVTKKYLQTIKICYKWESKLDEPINEKYNKMKMKLLEEVV